MTPSQINLLMKSLVQQKIKLNKEHNNFIRMCNRHISLYRESLEKRKEEYQEVIDSINRKIQELYIEELKNSLNKLILKSAKLFEEKSVLENDFYDARELGFTYEWEEMMNDYSNSIAIVEEKIVKLQNKIHLLSEAISF
jgi:hypothetical protein